MLTPPHNDGVHIVYIMGVNPCARHGADLGTPCWYLHISATKSLSPAVCGSRIKAAGYNGKISEESLRKSTKPNVPFQRRTRNSAPNPSKDTY